MSQSTKGEVTLSSGNVLQWERHDGPRGGGISATFTKLPPVDSDMLEASQFIESQTPTGMAYVGSFAEIGPGATQRARRAIDILADRDGRN